MTPLGDPMLADLWQPPQENVTCRCSYIRACLLIPFSSLAAKRSCTSAVGQATSAACMHACQLLHNLHGVARNSLIGCPRRCLCVGLAPEHLLASYCNALALDRHLTQGEARYNKLRSLPAFCLVERGLSRLVILCGLC